MLLVCAADFDIDKARLQGSRSGMSACEWTFPRKGESDRTAEPQGSITTLNRQAI